MKPIIKLSTMAIASVMLLASATLKTKTLKKVLTLEIPEGSGNNGAGVAWNPDKKLYYTAFAGNSDYPITVFDAKGKLKRGGFVAGFDVRGFWYNSSNQSLEGNSYGNYGYYAIKIDADGYPKSEANSTLPEDYDEELGCQPNEQSVAVLNTASGELLFREDGTVYVYDKANGTQKSQFTLTGLPCSWDEVAGYSMVYTGIKNQELAVYEYSARKIHMFSIAGTYTKTVKLPADAPNEMMFNFSYCNGMYWVFSTSQRKWYGYK